jgi:hypothetical protein
MSDTKSNKPTHTAYQVREGKNGGKGFWTRIGSAWQHLDAKGYNIQLDVVPLDGRITLRVIEEKKD